MDLKDILLNSEDWQNIAVSYVSASKPRFSQLMDCFYLGDFRLSHRATLIILQVIPTKPRWVAEQIPRMASTLKKELPDWYKRNLLRILQYQKIPEKQWGHVADQCFNYLASFDEPVAIKVFSMTVLYNLTRDLPDLAKELRFLIEEQYPLGSAGFKARGRKILSQLDKDGH